jgi:hypothetical protein
VTLTTLSAALLAAMLAWTPATDHAFTGEDGLSTVARYAAIARVAARVALDEEALPGLTHEESALALVAVGSFESGGWRRDVESCRVGGDSGHTWTLWALWGDHDKVCADPDLAARVALDRLRSSLNDCRRLPEVDRLSEYASGSCGAGRRESRHRWQRFRAWAAGASWRDAGIR